MEEQRLGLSSRIAKFLFDAYRWTSAGAPKALEPKMHGLGVDLLEYQRLNHPLYGKYCEIRGCCRRGVSILDYPPLPVESFKRADICPFDDFRTVAKFCSSGTTEGVRSVHRFRDLTLLQHALTYTFTMYIARNAPRGMRYFSLMPPYEENPTSSLGYMISRFVRDFGAPGSGYFFSLNGGLDVERLCGALEAAWRDGVPVHIMGPAFAYVEFLDRLGGRCFESVSGSCLLETGGYKGRVREVPKEELRDLLSRKLGISQNSIYGEYGMCELTSQGYEICGLNTAGDLPGECLYIFPPWLQCVIYNPENFAPVLPGNKGQIAFFDLCNLDSAAYILTGDIGCLVPLPASLQARVPGYPQYALRLYGRALSAIPKGCSMAWEEWQEAAARVDNNG